MKDIIEKKTEKPTTKGNIRYAFFLKDSQEWISTFDDELGQSLQEGDEAEFETYEKGGFINLKSAELILRGESNAETGIKPESTQKSPPRKTNGKRWHAYEDKEYQQAKDELIVRQMSYKAAVDMFAPFEPGAIDDEKMLTVLDGLKKISHTIANDIINGEDW